MITKITKHLMYEKLYRVSMDLKILDAAFESIEDFCDWPLSQAQSDIKSSILYIEDAIKNIEIKTINDVQSKGENDV